MVSDWAQLAEVSKIKSIKKKKGIFMCLFSYTNISITLRNKINAPYSLPEF